VLRSASFVFVVIPRKLSVCAFSCAASFAAAGLYLQQGYT
jgi:hypothetical protein